MTEPIRGYPHGFRMRHQYSGLANSAEAICNVCGYTLVSHSSKAVCEVCGGEAFCDLFPDHKHPKKILICGACYVKELKAATEASKEREARAKMENIKTPGDYFVADTPSIKEINDMVNADESVNNKAEKVCEIIKERIVNCQKNILELNQQTRERQKEQNEFQIYLNHKMKEISAEKQKELGLLNIDYKPEKPKKTPTRAPSTKKVDLQKMKEYAASFNIPLEALRIIVVSRSVSIEEAAKIYLKMSNKIEEEEEVKS